MSDYHPPIEDMLFALYDVAGTDQLPQGNEYARDDIRMVLESAGQLASEVLAPLNSVGDKKGVTLRDGVVTSPPGFKAAYKQYIDGGWNGVPFNPEHGGQGLPWPVAFAVQEMWQSANMGFGLCPMLNQGAVEAVEAHGTDEQKKIYLEKLISGEWTGTMNLTEPQAGTDLALIKSRAVRQADGTYKIRGQKIYITYGEHDFTSNIIHMVLARIDGAPEGVKGISMFVVPKFLPDANGEAGERNDLLCVSIEHKLGIHASPTCTMQFGDQGGAVGWLIGRENEGLKAMFTMMNNARLSVGLQGLAIAERAYQHAVVYAKGRLQGTALGDKTGTRVAIIEHPDVRRMLELCRAQVEAARALTYHAAAMMDRARRGDRGAQGEVDLLTPVVKAWCTDMAQEVCSTALQVHGGMGFIEETGAAQYFRDARITPIYEGTNGVQAIDLMFRKTQLDGGAAMSAWLDGAAGVDSSLDVALTALRQAANNLVKMPANDAAAVATPYLQAFGVIAGGVMLARGVAKATGDFKVRKDKTLAFYKSHVLPRYLSALATVAQGVAAVEALNAADF